MKMKKYYKERYDKRKANGQCVSCGKIKDSIFIDCVECHKKQLLRCKLWRDRNPLKVKENVKKSRLKDIEESRRKEREYRKNNLELSRLRGRIKSKKYRHKHPEAHKRWRQENLEHSKETNKNWNKNNKERLRESNRKYLKAHPERIKQRKIKYRNTHPLRRISDGISNQIRACLDGKKCGWHWEDLVGYTLDDLVKHLESKFTEGMSWETRNRTGWHIDHIRPISSFNITSYDCEDFKKCWALDNLRPMWATTRVINGVEYLGNLNKHTKIIPITYNKTEKKNDNRNNY